MRETIALYGNTLEKLTQKVKEGCEARGLKLGDVTVYMHSGMNGVTLRVVPKLWEEREIRGGHADETDPFDITP